jgi:hypothetical protein
MKGENDGYKWITSHITHYYFYDFVLAVPYIFFIYQLSCVFNSLFLVLLYSSLFTSGLYITTKKGDWGGGQKMYYTEGSYNVPARTFGKNRPEERALEVEILR